MTYQDSKDAQIEYLRAEIDRLLAETERLRRHCDDISHIKAMRQKEINRLKTPTPDGKCAVCGAYIGDTTYYKITDGKEIKK